MPEPESAARRVALVVGAEPAATATVAGALAALGAGDLGADADPRWVANLHRDLLERCDVEVDDARPTAWFETGKSCVNGITRARLADWLGARFVHPDGERAGQPRPELVVADPALGWLLGLWRAAALRCDAEAVQVVVLRPAQEVAAGAEGTAAWANRMLHLERATRGTPRVFLPYADVTRDWTIPFVTLGRELGLRSVQEATANQIRRAHEIVAAGPAAGPAPADTVGDRPAAIPEPLWGLVKATWDALTAPDGPDPETCDRLRQDYLELYASAESMTGSSVRAALRAVRATPAEPPGADASVRDRARGRVRRALGR